MSSLIQINDVCNMGCTFCGIARKGLTPDTVVRDHLRALRPDDASVTFGGGEPTLDPRLARWIRDAAESGLEEIQVETNALRFADASFTDHVVAAGLTGARVMLPAADAETWAAVTQLPGHLDHAWRGAANLLAAGVAVSVVTPVCTANSTGLTPIIRRVVDELVGARSLTLRPVFFSWPPGLDQTGTRGPAAQDLLAHATRDTVPLEQLAAALGEASQLAKSLELPFALDLAGGFPLCALRRFPEALASVRGRSVQYTYGPRCGDCAMRERCTGVNPVTREVHGAFSEHPFDRIPPVLSRNQNPEPIMMVSPGLPTYRFGEGDKAEIRLVMPCNQSCTFCFVNREAPNASGEELEHAVDQAVEHGVRAIVFTGGEPTLSRHLEPLLTRARDAGVPCRGIQTNALLLADSERARALVDAGLNHAHVSLHDHEPTRYLAISGFGTPKEAARGARNLLDAGVEVSVSLVINQVNVDNLPETLTFLSTELPGARVLLSVAREQIGLPRPWDETLVRYDRAGAAIGAALHHATDAGVELELAGSCCVPPCVVPREVFETHPQIFLTGHRTMEWRDVSDAEGAVVNAVQNSFAPQCERCGLRERCPGINRAYLARHGTAEFTPVAAGRIPDVEEA